MNRTQLFHYRRARALGYSKIIAETILSSSLDISNPKYNSPFVNQITRPTTRPISLDRVVQDIISFVPTLKEKEESIKRQIELDRKLFFTPKQLLDESPYDISRPPLSNRPGTGDGC